MFDVNILPVSTENLKINDYLILWYLDDVTSIPIEKIVEFSFVFKIKKIYSKEVCVVAYTNSSDKVVKTRIDLTGRWFKLDLNEEQKMILMLNYGIG